MLAVDHVTAGYGSVTALRGLSLHVDGGEFVGVVGRNGAGKSTLLSTVAGLVRPRSGDVTFEGRPLSGSDPEDIVRRGIALVPERRRIFTRLTVEENLMLGATLRNPRRKAKEEIDGVLERFPNLVDRYKSFGGNLSGGEQQQLAIARALLTRPRLLLLDEPSLGLAPKVVDMLFELLLTLRQEGVTILLVEQNVVRTFDVADRVYVVEEGRVQTEGPPTVLRATEDFERKYLGFGARARLTEAPQA